ncbi:hypothetical protein [Gordonia alkaliphila]|uniref:Uncharacterized protein n=1 Tax=Gordonia alkaliphila TaxID=1053547 RepID=A0ABP8ZCL3_9ACTN
MTKEDPLHVSFHVRDEAAARYLDKLIARSGGDPDEWFNGLIDEARQAAIAAVPARLAALAESVSRSIDYETVAAWDGVAPSNPPPRPASARAIRGDSTWRTR